MDGWVLDGGSMMLWEMFCWETLGPAIHVDATLMCTTYFSIVADRELPFMEMVFPNSRGLFQQDNTCPTKQKWFRYGFRSETTGWCF